MPSPRSTFPLPSTMMQINGLGGRAACSEARLTKSIASKAFRSARYKGSMAGLPGGSNLCAAWMSVRVALILSIAWFVAGLTWAQLTCAISRNMNRTCFIGVSLSFVVECRNFCTLWGISSHGQPNPNW